MKNGTEGGVILVAGAASASRTAGGTGVGGTRVASMQSTWT
jgi:hypothetical protein